MNKQKLNHKKVDWRLEITGLHRSEKGEYVERFDFSRNKIRFENIWRVMKAQILIGLSKGVNSFLIDLSMEAE